MGKEPVRAGGRDRRLAAGRRATGEEDSRAGGSRATPVRGFGRMRGRNYCSVFVLTSPSPARGQIGTKGGRRCQTACKPGSVPAHARAMTIHLGRPLPDASRDRPGRRRGNPPAGLSRRAVPIWSCSRWGLPCRPRRRERGALLPHPFTLAGGRKPRPAVCSLWHCPWGRPRRALPGTVSPWSPDFPPPTDVCPTEGGHPAVWLLGV